MIFSEVAIVVVIVNYFVLPFGAFQYQNNNSQPFLLMTAIFSFSFFWLFGMKLNNFDSHKIQLISNR